MSTQPELDPGEEKPEGGGEEEREVFRAKLEQDQLERRARQRASESAGEDGQPGLVFLRIYIPSLVPNLVSEGVYSLWPRALSPVRAPIL